MTLLWCGLQIPCQSRKCTSSPQMALTKQWEVPASWRATTHICTKSFQGQDTRLTWVAALSCSSMANGLWTGLLTMVLDPFTVTQSPGLSAGCMQRSSQSGDTSCQRTCVCQTAVRSSLAVTTSHHWWRLTLQGWLRRRCCLRLYQMRKTRMLQWQGTR